MLKVIVADDEARVCKLVLMLADWASLGMEVVGTASNGLEALDLVRLHKPDILITDIRMPGCYGLELIERAKLDFPQLEIVIISGYAHFEYAQKAIKHGVGDYLLKPIQKNELNATLEKLGIRCRERYSSADEIEQLKQTSQEENLRLRDQFIRDLVENRLEEGRVHKLLTDYRIEMRAGLFQVFALKMDYDPKAFTPASIGIVLEKAEKIFRTVIPERCFEAVFSFREPMEFGVLNYAPEHKDHVRKGLRDCLNQLTAQKSLFGAITFSLALGQAVELTEELPKSFRSALGMIAERLIDGTGRLLEGQIKPSALREENLLERYGRAIDHVVETLSLDEATAAVDLLEQVVEQIADVRGQELLQLVSSAGHLFVLRLGTQGWEEILREFDVQCNQCSNVSGLFACLRRLQQEQLELMAQRQRSEATRPIRMAKQYVQKHYSEPITLEEVCTAIGFSSSYFSVLFKKETGEGFAKFLTRVRIDRAKMLLQETSLSVAEICHQVGYGDLKHFSQTFKKMTSLNPAQYRKLYG